MKKIIQTLIVILAVFASSCSKEEKVIYNTETITDLQETNICGGATLGITKIARFSFPFYYFDTSNNLAISENHSARWTWRVYNDTLEVSGSILPSGYATEYHFFNKLECPQYLSSRVVKFDDQIQVGHPELSYQIKNYKDWQFELQKSIPNKKLVCRIDSRPIWIDFSVDNMLKAAPQYLLYYHPN